MSFPRLPLFLPLGWLLLAWFPLSVSADLTPSDLAVLANGSSRQSLSLANYYATKRKIPADNICAVAMPLDESLSREEWEQTIRPAIRRWLSAPQRQRIRCLVTTWDVPLKIGKALPVPVDITAQIQFLRGEKEQRLRRASRLTRKLDSVAGLASPTPLNERNTSSDNSTLGGARSAFRTALASAQQRVNALDNPALQQTATDELQQIVTVGAGLNAIVQALAAGVQNNPHAKDQLERQLVAVKAQVQGLSEARTMIEATPLTLEHHYLSLAILDRTHGLFDAMKWIDGRVKKLSANETNASFDSELSCVLWPEYNRLLWQPNYLNSTFAQSPLRDVFPTIMVSRIDGPSLKLCKSIVDTSIETEQSGLQGKFYLDGRGLAKPGQKVTPANSYERYDLTLMATANRLKGNGRVELVYQNEPRLFQPGECPDAALYCGWYSVEKYVDAFEWNPGAVAYHLASYELKTLRKADSNGWCKRLLEDGVCATIGAVQEPYLEAFPRPDLFFPLLLSGKKTLVECYYETKPFNSWAVALVGDPLYRPFK